MCFVPSDLQTGAVPPCVQLLASSDEPCRETAVIALRKFITSQDAKMDIVKSDGIRLLAREWKYRIPDTHDHCDYVLDILSAMSEENKKLIEEEKAKPFEPEDA